MMRFLATTVLVLLLLGCSATTKKYHERHYQSLLCDELDGEMEYRLKDRTRVDCLTDEYAIEVDFAKKWAESIGQSLYYAQMTGKKPAVGIIIDSEKEMRYFKRLNLIAQLYEIKIFIIEKEVEERIHKMIIVTNKKLLKEYTRLFDRDSDVKNFRLFYKDKPTNLVWYDGKIIFIPKEYFELKNLINVDINKKQKCSLYPPDIKLLRELKEHKIDFLLEGNLGELFKRIGLSGLIFSDDIAIELYDDNDYASIIEPIYLSDGAWLNLDLLARAD